MRKAIKQLFKKGNNNILKIFLLGLGLAAGVTLIAKVYFEMNFNNYIPDNERVYIIEEIVTTSDIEGKKRDRIPGAVSQGIQDYSPLVEIATKFTWLSQSQLVETEEGKRVQSGNLILADSTLFDVFPRKILSGNIKEGFCIKGYIFISKTFADKLISNNDYLSLVGKTLKADWHTFTIGGVFEDYPRNSDLFDIHGLVTMNSIGLFMYDGRDNWVGNDRYAAFIKLVKNANLDEINSQINKMCQENLPHERLEKAGVKLEFGIKPLAGNHLQEEGVKEPLYILIIIAVILIFASVFNYVLITISAMVRKAKKMAVLKCYGATKKDIYSLFLAEAFIHLLLALILAFILIFSFRSFIGNILSVSIEEIFGGNCFIVVIIISLIVLLIGGLLPGYLYSKIPVASAFRGYKERTRKWKYILLFTQFTFSMLFITLLIISLLQYRMMMGANVGYNYKNLVYSSISAITPDKCITLKKELSKLNCVNAVSFSYSLPMFGYSGNNVNLPNDDKDYFNIADLEYVGEGYFNLMEIPIISGNNFDEKITNNRQIMVSRSFNEKLSEMKNWDDGVIGKEVHISAYGGFYTICGIYEDFIIGNHLWNDKRASVAFLANDESKNIASTNNILIKLKELNQENINIVKEVIDNIAPGKEIEVISYANEYEGSYIEYKKLKDSILMAGIIVLLITIIGLSGYSKDEINKRRSEIAVRKINGATLAELIGLFIKQIISIAIPAIIIGGIGALYAGNYGLESVATKINLSWWIFCISGICTILIIITVTICTIIKTANTNPVENLKSE